MDAEKRAELISEFAEILASVNKGDAVFAAVKADHKYSGEPMLLLCTIEAGENGFRVYPFAEFVGSDEILKNYVPPTDMADPEFLN